MKEHLDPTIGKMVKIQQMGVQYLLYLQELAKKRADLYALEFEKEQAHVVKMRELKRKQEKKIKELEARNSNSEYLEHLHDERL